MKKLIDTGIPGLNELLGGGLPEGSLTVVSGPPGIGKTAVAMQYIYNGIARDEPGIFLSIENNVEEVIDYAANFGWDFRRFEEEKKLKILDRNIFEEADMELGLDFGIVKDTMEALKPGRVVVDSLTLFSYIFKDDIARRQHMLRLIDLLKVRRFNCTTLMTSEQEENAVNIRFHDWHYLSDGIICLFWSRDNAENERRIWVPKLKGGSATTSIKPFKITSKGAEILYNETPNIVEV